MQGYGEPVSGCACGNQENDEHARFCSECGKPLGEQTGLLGVSQPKTLSTTTTAKSSAIDWRWLAAALAVTVGLIAWSATSGGSQDESETAEEPDASSTTIDRSSTTTPTTTAPSTTTAPPTTEASLSDAEDEIVPQFTVEEIGDGGSLFGEPIGFKLLASGSNRLLIIDPDEGTVARQHSSTSPAQPLAVTGEWLLVGTGTEVGRVPISALEVEPVRTSPEMEVPGQQFSLTQPTGDDGTIWVQQFDGLSGFPMFVRIDVESGAELDRIDLDGVPTRINTFNPPVGDLPMLFGVPAGGTYEFVDGRFRRTTDAQLLTADIDHVLVSACDEQLNCPARWLDRTTWEPVERQVPEGPFDLAEVIDGTDWLMLTSFSSGGSKLYNTASGASIDLRDRFFGADRRETMAISPDGRWMATRVGMLIEMTDLETGEEQMIAGVPTDGRIIFTDADVGFAGELDGAE